MGNKAIAAQEDLRSILPSLVKCSSTKGFGTKVLPAVCELLDAPTAVMHYFVANDAQSLFFDPIYVNLSERYLDEFRQRYSDQDPFPKAALTQYLDGNGSAFASEQLVNMDELAQTDFYRFFLQPQSIHHMLVVVISRRDQPFAFLGFHRPKSAEPFSKHDLALAEELAPFLSAVADRVHLREELALYQRALDTLSYGLMSKGVLVLDEKLTMVFANEYARRTLGDRNDFDGEIRHYPTAIAEACEKLLGFGHELGAMDSVGFELEDGAPKITGHVRISDQAGSSRLFLVFFTSDDYGVLNPRVCDAFGLTNREMEITRCVIEGRTNSEVGEDLDISVRTVQNHLRSIYEKCEVNNRTSLSNRVLSLL